MTSSGSGADAPHGYCQKRGVSCDGVDARLAIARLILLDGKIDPATPDWQTM
jgi:hypothetical protein